MLKTVSCCGAILLAACNPAAIRDNDLRAAARQAAQIRFAAECGTVTVPDRAYLPIEITGDGGDEFVLSFARAACAKNPSLWVGTGGSLFQVWTDDAGKPRMVLEQTMHGFRHDYKSAILTADQRGGSCGNADQDICRVVYRWDPVVHTLVIAERQSSPNEPLPVPGPVARRESSRQAVLSSQSQTREKQP